MFSLWHAYQIMDWTTAALLTLLFFFLASVVIIWLCQRDTRFVSNATIAKRHVGIAPKISRAFLRHWSGR